MTNNTELLEKVAQEAHTMGRIYTKGGEKLKPAEEFQRVSDMVKRFKKAADALSAVSVGELDALEKRVLTAQRRASGVVGYGIIKDGKLTHYQDFRLSGYVPLYTAPQPAAMSEPTRKALLQLADAVAADKTPLDSCYSQGVIDFLRSAGHTKMPAADAMKPTADVGELERLPDSEQHDALSALLKRWAALRDSHTATANKMTTNGAAIGAMPIYAYAETLEQCIAELQYALQNTGAKR